MSHYAIVILWGDCPCVYQINVIVAFNQNGVICMHSYNDTRPVDNDVSTT